MKRLGRKSVDVLQDGTVVIHYPGLRRAEFIATTILRDKPPQNTTRHPGRLPYRGG